jgi:hypothetical protein
MAMRGVRATAAQRGALCRWQIEDLVRECGLHSHTVAAAVAGAAVHPLTLRAVLEAAARLAAQPGANDAIA